MRQSCVDAIHLSSRAFPTLFPVATFFLHLPHKTPGVFESQNERSPLVLAAKRELALYPTVHASGHARLPVPEKPPLGPAAETKKRPRPARSRTERPAAASKPSLQHADRRRDRRLARQPSQELPETSSSWWTSWWPRGRRARRPATRKSARSSSSTRSPPSPAPPTRAP